MGEPSYESLFKMPMMLALNGWCSAFGAGDGLRLRTVCFGAQLCWWQTTDRFRPSTAMLCTWRSGAPRPMILARWGGSASA